MHNEEQARTLWCPMVRFSPVGAGESYRNATTRGDVCANCIASRCALWRWQNPAEPVNYLRLGYCGLAGKPNA